MKSRVKALVVSGFAIFVTACENQRNFLSPREIEDTLLGRKYMLIQDGNRTTKIPKSCLKPSDFASYKTSGYQPGCVLDRMKAATSTD